MIKDWVRTNPTFLVNLCGMLLLLRTVIFLLNVLDKYEVLGFRYDRFSWLVPFAWRHSTWGCDATSGGAFIDYLPDECLLHIYRNLRHIDLFRCSQVSKRWKRLTREQCLWRDADFSWIPKLTYLHTPKQDKMERYAKHLLNSTSRVGLRSLRYAAWRVLDERTSAILAKLFIAPHISKSLDSLYLRWVRSWEDISGDSFEQAFLLFLALLTVIRDRCPAVTNLSIQLNWTLDSVETMSSMCHLQRLDIDCVPRVHVIQKWQLEKVVSQLINLRYFKLLVAILPKNVQRYSLRSESLESLDISYCTNLHLIDLYLPKLRILRARGLRYYSTSSSVCLFRTLRYGCPALTTLEGDENLSSNIVLQLQQENMGLDDLACHKIRICNCREHNKMNRATGKLELYVRTRRRHVDATD